MSDAPTPNRDTIDDTLDWLAARAERCSFLASALGNSRERTKRIDDAAKFKHAHSLIRRAYRPERPLR